MIHSEKISAQQVVSACLSYRVKRVVISPGSRNAPLIIEFNAYDSIQKYSIVDERSAAFFALGMAQKTQEPVALVCSSGSALLNYYPAIAEAYYSSIPLVVISADRPKELIDIGDGQTIRQEYVYQNHIHYSANLSIADLDENYRKLKDLFSVIHKNKGPVHINVPFDEPLYNTVNSTSVDTDNWTLPTLKNSLLDEVPLEVDALQKYAEIWNKATRKMVLLGVSQPDAMLQTQLEHLIKDPSVIVLTENTSNVQHPQFINRIDQVIFPFTDAVFEAYKPDVLLTFGSMVVSKKIKQLLRKNQPKEHWHIDAVRAMDTYHCLTKHFEISPTLFFSQFFFLSQPVQSSYQKKWLELKALRIARHDYFMTQAPFTDLKVFYWIHQYIPDVIHIQFSNSSTIRYAQLSNWNKSLKIACNRGTSGIDGSVSTAIGAASVSKTPTLLVTGDLSFFYDSNALWNAYMPAHFRIILINNGGGGIFSFLPGPGTTDYLNFFDTPHHLKAENLCAMHQVNYYNAKNEMDFKTQLNHFFEPSSRPKLLEVCTSKHESAQILKAYFKNLSSK